MRITLTPISSKAEVTELIPLVQEIWQECYTPIIGREAVTYMLSEFQSAEEIFRQVKNNVCYFFANVNDQRVGYIAYELVDNQLFISKLYLLNSQRGQGFASEIFSWLEGKARAEGKSQLSLHVNQENYQSILVYEARGFVNQGELTTEIGQGFQMIDYVFEKVL